MATIAVGEPAPGATSNKEIAAEAAANAGFTGEGLRTVIGIGGAESNWTMKRGGPNSDGTYDWGVWQINDVHHPTADEKTDVIANARAAWKISSHGKSFTPWTTYNSGAYKRFLPPASGPGSVGAGGGMGAYTPPDPAGAIKSALPDVPGAITNALNAFNKQALKVSGNIIMTVLAVVLFSIGILIVMRSQVSKVGGAAALVTPVGKAGAVASSVAGAVGTGVKDKALQVTNARSGPPGRHAE